MSTYHSDVFCEQARNVSRYISCNHVVVDTCIIFKARELIIIHKDTALLASNKAALKPRKPAGVCNARMRFYKLGLLLKCFNFKFDENGRLDNVNVAIYIYYIYIY